jgi:hypothetical protein
VLDQRSAGPPDEFQEDLHDVYKEMMPVVKRIFHATIEAHENLLSVEASSEMAELQELNRRIGQICPDPSFQLDPTFLTSMMHVVRYLALLKNDESGMVFSDRGRLYRALRQKAVAFADARGFPEAEFLDALGGMEKRTLLAQMKVAVQSRPTASQSSNAQQPPVAF